ALSTHYFLARLVSSLLFSIFFFHAPAPTETYTLSLHDALPISRRSSPGGLGNMGRGLGSAKPSPFRRSRNTSAWRRAMSAAVSRSEEHTSELQSRSDLVCRLLLEKKKKNIKT